MSGGGLSHKGLQVVSVPGRMLCMELRVDSLKISQQNHMSYFHGPNCVTVLWMRTQEHKAMRTQSTGWSEKTAEKSGLSLVLKNR